MVKHYRREQRAAFIRTLRMLAQAFPGRCVICADPATTVTMEFRDFLGGDAELDGIIEAPICQKCLAEGHRITSGVIKAKA